MLREHTVDFKVEGQLVTDVRGALPNGVLSTPGMIAMMEFAATSCALEELGEGGFTVGFEVCVKHFGAAAEGSECTATARLKELEEGRKFRFEVEVHEGERLIGAGTHERRMPKAAAH